MSENAPNVPYIVHEGIAARNERVIRRLIAALVFCIFLIFASNAIWLYAWMQYDYVSEDVTVDSKDGGNANYIGNDGDIINNGESKSSETKPYQKRLEREEKTQMKQYADIPASQLTAMIDEWIHSDSNRRIAKRRLIDGICYEPLAEEFGLSTRQVKNIVYKVEETIFKHLDITA